MQDYLKTSNKKLLENLLSIFEIPERVNNLDIVTLKELLIYIENDKLRRLKYIDNLLVIKNYNYPKEYQPNKHFEYWANTTSNDRITYNQLIRIETDIKKRIEVLKNTSTNITIESNFNNKVFSNIESERFFLYVVNDWIIDKKEPLVYISYLFRQLWEKEKENSETVVKEYTIHCLIDVFLNYCNGNLKLKKTITKIKTYYDIGHKTRKLNKIRTLLDTFKQNGSKKE